MRVYVESPDGDIEGRVEACRDDFILEPEGDIDLDGAFMVIADDGTRWRVNGWCCRVKIIDD